MERTLAIIKPDAVANKAAGRILARIRVQEMRRRFDIMETSR